MTKTILFTIAAIAILASGASAQQRTYYDASGKVVGRASTDSQGTTTFYDAGGKVTGRAATEGGKGQKH